MTDAEMARKVRASLLSNVQRDIKWLDALKARNELRAREIDHLHKLKTMVLPKLLADVERDRCECNAGTPA